MTNNPTIDGVSRSTIEAIIGDMGTKAYVDAWKELRALLDADIQASVSPPNPLREHCKQCAEVVKTWPEWKQNCLGGAPAVKQQDASVNWKAVATEQMDIIDQRQSTIAQLQGQLAAQKENLESAVNNSVMFAEQADQLQAENSRVNVAWHDMKRELDLTKARVQELESGSEPAALVEVMGGGAQIWTALKTQQLPVGVHKLFTAPPAPVAVGELLSVDEVIEKLEHFIGANYGTAKSFAASVGCTGAFVSRVMKYKRIPKQWLELIGVEKNVTETYSCLDATAALNNHKPAEWHDVAGDAEGLDS